MKNKSLLMTVAILIIATSTVGQVLGSFTDSRDGKIYKTVKIGTQTWMAENLALKADSGCWAYNNEQSNAAIYGYLYKWETAKIVCPTGWHLPDNTEWAKLTDYLGGIESAYDKLKESGTKHWTGLNSATNSTGFTAIPGGSRSTKGTFSGIGSLVLWWSASEESASNATAWGMDFFYHDVNNNEGSKKSGLGIRCVMD